MNVLKTNIHFFDYKIYLLFGIFNRIILYFYFFIFEEVQIFPTSLKYTRAHISTIFLV